MKTTEEIIKEFNKKFPLICVDIGGDQAIHVQKEVEAFLTSTITDIQREMVEEVKKEIKEIEKEKSTFSHNYSHIQNDKECYENGFSKSLVLVSVFIQKMKKNNFRLSQSPAKEEGEECKCEYVSSERNSVTIKVCPLHKYLTNEDCYENPEIPVLKPVTNSPHNKKEEGQG